MMDVAVGTTNGAVTVSMKVNVPTSPVASLTVPAARYDTFGQCSARRDETAGAHDQGRSAPRLNVGHRAQIGPDVELGTERSVCWS